MVHQQMVAPESSQPKENPILVVMLSDYDLNGRKNRLHKR